jgi:hypothetical protein
MRHPTTLADHTRGLPATSAVPAPTPGADLGSSPPSDLRRENLGATRDPGSLIAAQSRGASARLAYIGKFLLFRVVSMASM